MLILYTSLIYVHSCMYNKSNYGEAKLISILLHFLCTVFTKQYRVNKKLIEFQ